MGSNLKVGIPRGLFWYCMPERYRIFWEALGFEVVTSPPTNRKIFEEGIRCSHEELCLPVKVFYGHIAFLKDKVDLIFIPRIVSVMKKGEKRFGCPKFIGLPDLIKNSLSGIPPVISVNLTLVEKGLEDCFFEMGKKLGIEKRAIKDAVRKMLDFETESNFFRKSKDRDSSIRIGVIGHPYLLYDNYISAGLLNKLSSLKVDYITSSEPPKELIEEEIEDRTNLFWIYERELVGAAHFFSNKGQVDGIILCVNFGCGPGSVVMEMIQRKVMRGKRMPFFILVIDENLQEAGLMTRLEAFCDMVRINKK